MRFKLTEGKNLEQTVQQYVDKYQKMIPLDDDELYIHRNHVMGLISIDPTYKPGGNVTGDYAIWILNQAIKNGWDVIGTKQRVLHILTEFQDKKSLLKNKDIMSYKTPDDLAQALSEVELTDRQKERRARNATAMTKKVLSTENWDVYMALNWEGALTLGKGTKWCTADSENAAWYVKYVMDYWHDENVEAFEVKNCAKEQHITTQELLDYPKFLYGKYAGEHEVASEEEIYARYSDRAVFVDVQGEGFFVNPFEKLEDNYPPYNRLFVFINKNDGSKYQFCMSEDLSEYEDDLEYALTFCYQNDQYVDFRNFIGYEEKELREFWTDIMGYSMQELFSVDPDEEDDIEESLSTNKMRFTLVEGIADVKKHYQDISDEDFDRIIRLDPTFNENRDRVGTYGKWLLNLFRKGNLNNEGHVSDLLNRFESEKPHLKDKNIGRFKSLDEVDAYLNDDSNYTSLSHRQEVRQRQKDRHNVDLGEEASLVYEDDEWQVWIPKTYAASCKLGQGTKWCTASTETDSYFYAYTKTDDLYININKKTGEKYQFHFESESYMDESDNEIELDDFLLNNMELCTSVYYPLLPKPMRVAVNFMIEHPGGAISYDVHTKIPSAIRYYVHEINIVDGVTTIPNKAFAQCVALSKVTFPSSVLAIGDSAFENCYKLKDISLPHSLVKIGNNAFKTSGVTQIDVPASVATIGHYAFYSCKNLMSVHMSDGVSFLGGNVFQYCKNLKEVTISSNIENILDGTFAECDSLRNISIPNKVSSIGQYAFSGCDNLESINIPNGVKSIGMQAFSSCLNLKEVNIPLGVDVVDWAAFYDCPNAIIYCESESLPVGWDEDWRHDDGTTIWGDNSRKMSESFPMRFTLTEDIAAVQKNFPNIDDETFKHLIALDPTFNPNRDSVGTYGKWILTLYNKGEIKDEDWDNVSQMLDVWETNKKRFTNKDIGQFKTLKQLEDALLDMPDLELSHRQKVRQNQKNRRKADLGTDADLVFDGSDWEVWVPKTYSASCKLGQHTSWCTASTERDDQYKNYTSQGPLYILIDKGDDRHKYQFHFETNSFMDRNDDAINLIEFLGGVGEEVSDFFFEKLFDSWDLLPGLSMDDTIEVEIKPTQLGDLLREIAVGYNNVPGNDCFELIFNADDYMSEFYYDDFYEEFLGVAIEYTNEENKKQIEKLTGVTDLTTANIINYDGFLYEAFMDAIKKAYIESAVYNAETEAVLAVEDAASAVKGIRADLKSDVLVVKGKLSAFVDLYSDYCDFADEATYRFDDNLSRAVGTCLIQNYNFQKPRADEWGELEDDLFNECLENALYDWFGNGEE